jgi:hypothetical protein
MLFRCQSAIIVDNVNDNLGICYACQYTFCRKCEKTFHFQTTCPKDYVTVQMRLRQEKEREKKQEDRQRIGKQQEKELHRMGKQQEKEQEKEQAEECRRKRKEQEKELHKMGKQQEKEQEKEQAEERRRKRREQKNAIAQLKKIEEEKKPAATVQKYRQIVIDLSEEDGLLEEILTSVRIESLNTQHCPNCHVRIEKNGGCSHMHCSRCDHHFTWESIQKPEVSNSTSLLNYSSNNSMQIESIKEELNNQGDIGLQ